MVRDNGGYQRDVARKGNDCWQYLEEREKTSFCLVMSQCMCSGLPVMMKSTPNRSWFFSFPTGLRYIRDIQCLLLY